MPCTRDHEFGTIEARLDHIEEACQWKRENLDRLERQVIPSLVQWQERALGIAIGLTTAGGLVGALLAYILTSIGGRS